MSGDTLEQIADDYARDHRADADRELRYYAVLRTDDEAISKAALAQLPNGKRHPHQYRVPRAALAESRERLLLNLTALKAARTFDELFELVRHIIDPIPGIGELTVYDTSLRIGAHFGLAPQRIYLHAGTREGARALGLDSTRQTVEREELPAAFAALSARVLEDILCIYKNRLARLRDPPTSDQAPAESRCRSGAQ